jgi:hypothetical protein
MVRGIQVFKEYFRDFPDSYIIIGGTACDIIMSNSALNPRATKDIDIILVVEALTPDFVQRFWQFIIDGNFENSEQNPEEKKYYRFSRPANPAFPLQIELFSRLPDLIKPFEGIHLTPIPVGEDLSSLSAILLNDDYYNYILHHTTLIDDLKLANIEALICFKAVAWLELTTRKINGESIDESKIKKHKADIFRLVSMLPLGAVFELPLVLKTDLQRFVTSIRDELPGDELFQKLGQPALNSAMIYTQLIRNFNLSE